MSIFFCIVTLASGQFLRLSPGVLSQGLGGASVVINEGLSIFHNPAYTRDREFNFTLSRWLYSTDYLTVGAAYANYILGITYMNYGRIQGYDELGNPTAAFTPYDVCAGIGRKIGPIGLAVKVFNERIEDETLYGVCASAGLFIDNERLAFGLKVDNFGKELSQNTSIPMFMACGLRYRLIEDLDVLAEAKLPILEANGGFIYTYHDLRVFMGAKYILPADLAGDSDISSRKEDLYFTGGVLVRIDRYDIGYSIVYGPLSAAHQFSVAISP
ncbi:MAG: hypothetical protein JSW49_05990 [candidate division WOR-3 bacterium]|nr:MAG: hypothetical protein JSW49_05990 [candidate division WOR-3 bacterium]